MNVCSSCAFVVTGKYPVCAFQYACDSGEIRNFTNSHVARSFFESLLFSAHREAPPMDTPPSSLEDTFGKYAVPTSNFPFTSCRICFNEAVDPSVIADFPAEKSARPASPPFPTIGAYPSLLSFCHAVRMFLAAPFLSKSTAVAASVRPFPLLA